MFESHKVSLKITVYLKVGCLLPLIVELRLLLSRLVELLLLWLLWLGRAHEGVLPGALVLRLSVGRRRGLLHNRRRRDVGVVSLWSGVGRLVEGLNDWSGCLERWRIGFWIGGPDRLRDGWN